MTSGSMFSKFWILYTYWPIVDYSTCSASSVYSFYPIRVYTGFIDWVTSFAICAFAIWDELYSLTKVTGNLICSVSHIYSMNF